MSSLSELQNRLLDAADQLRANSWLRLADCSWPVMGLIADYRFQQADKRIQATWTSMCCDPGPLDYQAQAVIFLPEEARYDHLLSLLEDENIGMGVNDAMRAIKATNFEPRGELPTTIELRSTLREPRVFKQTY